MDSVNSSSDLSSQALSSAASLLLSLNGGASSDTAGAKLFANFLSQTQTGGSAYDASSKTNAQSSFVTGASKNSAPNGTLASLPVLKNLSSALHRILDKLQGQNGSKFASGASQKDATTRGNNSSSSATAKPKANAGTSDSDQAANAQDANSSGASQTPAQSCSNTTNSSPAPAPATSATASADNTTADSSAPPTVTDVLAALQLLAQMVQQQLQATQPAGNTADPSQATDASSANADNATGNSASNADPLTMTQALTNLLMLAQLAAKQLGATQAAADQSLAAAPASGDASTQAATSTPATLPSDAQLLADLKALMDAIKANIGAAQNDAGQTTVAAGAGSTTAVAASQDSPLKTSVAPLGASKNDWIQQDSFLNLFNPTPANMPNTQAATNASFVPFATGGMMGDASGKDGASLDLDLNSQGSNTAARASDGTNLSTAVPASSSASPYSFASQLSATRTANLGPTGLPAAVEQVILQLNRNAKSGNDQMTLQLNPADLGRVSIKLDFGSDGKVQGTVVADNPATLDLLFKDVRSLERALQEAGLRADPGSLQFSLGGQTGQSFAQTPGDSSSSSAKWNASLAPDITTDLSAVSADTTETYYLTPNRVNLRV